MGKIELEIEKRSVLSKELKAIRKKGFIPAIVYGKKMEPISVAVNQKLFTKIVLKSEAGLNAIVSLKLTGEKEIPALTHQVQMDPLTDEILHIDFRHIVMDEVIKTKVPVELMGIPVGVKETGGVLVHGLREVEVECLPGDIPDKIEIDVTSLKIGDSFHVADLKQITKVKVVSTPTEMIANCSPPTKEEVVEAVVPTPEEAAAKAETDAAAGAVADEKVKEKGAPGAAPGKTASAAKPDKK